MRLRASSSSLLHSPSESESDAAASAVLPIGSVMALAGAEHLGSVKGNNCVNSAYVCVHWCIGLRVDMLWDFVEGWLVGTEE